MTRPAQTGFHPAVESLDRRDLMSVSSTWMTGTLWVAKCDNAATSLSVSESGTNFKITDSVSGASWLKPKAQVTAVQLQGGNGNDKFIGNVSTLRVELYGGAGHDYLEGYNAADYMDGGAGNDSLVGYGGNDLLFGQAGNDVLLGGDGNDELQGNADNDRLNGQAGTDKLFGQAGADVLVAVDAGGTDYAEGGDGIDAVWVDTGDNAFGAAGNELQRLTSFANGADRTLNGDSITDPAAVGTYKSFRNDLKLNNRPLYASAGPQMDDVKQGREGDCWLLAGLSAFAMDGKDALRQRVVDFDDGTYGVRLGNNFYRVDGDLPTNTDGSLAYAKQGAEGSMWVAVVEKAYAHYRTGANSYASLNGGWSVDVNKAFGSTTAGEKSIGSYSNATALANDLYTRWSTYQAVTIGFTDGRYGSGARIGTLPLVNAHMYTVARFNRASNGTVTSIVLRNPWGTDGYGSDGANDGYVTVTPAQLFGVAGRVNWGRVS